MAKLEMRLEFVGRGYKDSFEVKIHLPDRKHPLQGWLQWGDGSFDLSTEDDSEKLGNFVLDRVPKLMEK